MFLGTRGYGRPLLVAALAVASYTTIPAQAQTLQDGWASTVHRSKPTIVYQADDVDLDCTTLDIPNVQVTVPPKHGKVSIVRAKVHPHFKAPNRRAKCDSRWVEGINVYYTADSGYRGADKLVVLNHAAAGVSETTITVTVR